MKIVNPSAMPGVPEEWKRPRGTYRRTSRDLTGALGMGGGPHPFEVEHLTLAPGETNWPYHHHSAMWELYHVLSGTGMVRHPDGRTEVKAGDWFVHPPGETHNLTNTGAGDLVYVVLSDEVDGDRSTILDG